MRKEAKGENGGRRKKMENRRRKMREEENYEEGSERKKNRERRVEEGGGGRWQEFGRRINRNDGATEEVEACGKEEEGEGTTVHRSKSSYRPLPIPQTLKTDHRKR